MSRLVPVDPAAAARALLILAEKSASPPGTPARSTPDDGEMPALDLSRVQRIAGMIEGWARLQQAAAEAAADEAFDGVRPPDDPLEAELWQALVAINRALVAHPVAARAACDALRAEGRRYAETAEGAALKHRLERSPIVARAEFVWRSATMGIFDGEPDPNQVLPSAWFDAFTRLAGWEHLERLLGRLGSGEQ